MVKSKSHLFYLLKITKEEFKDIVQNTDKFYYTYKKIKKDKINNIRLDKYGLPLYREICPSIDPLKQIQTNIKNNIFKKIEYPDYLQGGIAHRDNVRNAKMHLGKKFHFLTDLKAFFPNISPDRVYLTLINFNFSPDVSHILTKLITFRNFVPQGAPTSSYIANMIFMKTDKLLFEYCQQNNITYTRFIDDLSFSSQNDFKNNLQDIIHIINTSKFKLNHRKTYYKIGPSLITGVLTKNNVLDVSKEFNEKMSNLNTFSKDVKKGLENYYNKVRLKKI